MNSDCVWYVSGFIQPWEADVIGNLAEALRARGVSLKVYSKGGTAHLHVEEVMSWNSLTFFERMKAVLFGGKLWHLWGDAPVWWGLVRMRARTVHTSLSAAKVGWRGHPTRLFNEQARGGENRILPTFEPKASWKDSWSDDEPDAALLMGWNGDAGTRKNILEAWASVSEEAGGRFRQSKVLVAGDTPSGALQAAFMTMRGVPVVAADAPLIRELLGPGGYVPVPQAGGAQEWKQALLTAASEAGRSVSGAARRFLKENYSADDAAETLKNLYGTVGGSRL